MLGKEPDTDKHHSGRLSAALADEKIAQDELAATRQRTLSENVGSSDKQSSCYQNRVAQDDSPIFQRAHTTEDMAESSADEDHAGARRLKED